MSARPERIAEAGMADMAPKKGALQLERFALQTMPGTEVSVVDEIQSKPIPE